MSTDDIKAAAERVRRVRHNGEPIMVVYGSLTVETCGEAELEITHDVHRLADAYLAEHQADDDEEIDAEWLSEQTLPFLAGVLLKTHGDGWYLAGQGITALVTTRGQLRLLLRAMGVTP